MDLITRFWNNVEKTDGCWNYRGTIDAKGYGQIYGLRKCRRAHRVSYELHCGPIPEGLGVLHHCDNRVCVRPDHLFVGTQADNMLDMDRKARRKGIFTSEGTTGTSNPSAVLDEEQVKAIRQSYKPRKTTHKDLAARFGVSPNTIYLILKNKTWKHL